MRMSNRAVKLLKNTGIYALGEIIPKLFTFLIFPIYTRHIEPSQYGIIDYINTIDTFISVFCILSLNTYFLYAYYKEDTETGKKRLFGSLSVFSLAFTIFISVLLHVIGPAAFKSWGSDVPFYPYISLGIVSNIFNIVTLLPICLYRVKENPLPITIITICKSAFVLIGTTLAVTYFNGAAYEVLFVRVVIGALFAFIYIYLAKDDILLCLDKRIIVKALRFSLPLVPGAVAYYVFNLFDRILIEKYLTLGDLAIFSTASSLAMMLNIVSNGAYRSFEPYFFQTFGSDSFNNNFCKVRDTLLTVVVIFAFAIGIFSKEFFEIFTSPLYYVAYNYVPIILIGAIIYSISLMYETILIAKGMTIKCTLITFIGAFTSILLNVIFLKRYGIYSASLVLSFSFLLVLLLRIRYAKVNVEHFRGSTFVILSSIFMCFILYSINFNNIFFSILLKFMLWVIFSLFSVKYMKVDTSSL